MRHCRLDLSGKVVSAAGWLPVSFATAYAIAPVVVAAPEITANQYSTVKSVTASGFEVGVIVTSTGTFVAGITVGWVASGIR